MRRRSWRLLVTTLALGTLSTVAQPARAQGPGLGGSPTYLPTGGAGFLPYTPGPGGGLGVMPPSGPATNRMTARPSALSEGMAEGLQAGPRALLPSYRGTLGRGIPRGMGGGSLGLGRPRSGMTGRSMPGRAPVGSYPFRLPTPLTPLAPAAPGMSM